MSAPGGEWAPQWVTAAPPETAASLLQRVEPNLCACVSSLPFGVGVREWVMWVTLLRQRNVTTTKHSACCVDAYIGAALELCV